jgi:hypothetical protein
VKEVHNVGSMRAENMLFVDDEGYHVAFTSTTNPVWPYRVVVSTPGFFSQAILDTYTTKRRPNATHAQRMKLQALEQQKSKEQAS